VNPYSYFNITTTNGEKKSAIPTKVVFFLKGGWYFGLKKRFSPERKERQKVPERIEAPLQKIRLALRTNGEDVEVMVVWDNHGKPERLKIQSKVYYTRR